MYLGSILECGGSIALQVVGVGDLTALGSGAAWRQVSSGLGRAYVDGRSRYSVRFPAGWSARSYEGDPWVLDASDGRNGIISVGFSPFPADVTIDQLKPENLAKHLKGATAHTVIHA